MNETLAPHLTDPLPFLVLTYDRGVQHRQLMRLALKLYDLLSYDRNRNIEESRWIPSGRLVAREECLRLAPGLNPRGVTGGAIWFDGGLRDPARLTLEFVRTAAEAGATVANYVEVVGFLRTRRNVAGVIAAELLSGNRLEIRASVVISATGPWIYSLLGKLGRDAPRERIRYVRSINVVTRAVTLENHGLGLTGPQVGAPNRIFRYFIAPWRGHSVIGSVDCKHSVAGFCAKVSAGHTDSNCVLFGPWVSNSPLLPRSPSSRSRLSGSVRNPLRSRLAFRNASTFNLSLS